MLCVSGRGAGIVVLLLEQAGLTSSCGEGSRLGTAGEVGLLGTQSGNYGLIAGMAFPESLRGDGDEPVAEGRVDTPSQVLQPPVSSFEFLS